MTVMPRSLCTYFIDLFQISHQIQADSELIDHVVLLIHGVLIVPIMRISHWFGVSLLWHLEGGKEWHSLSIAVDTHQNITQNIYHRQRYVKPTSKVSLNPRKLLKHIWYLQLRMENHWNIEILISKSSDDEYRWNQQKRERELRWEWGVLICLATYTHGDKPHLANTNWSNMILLSTEPNSNDWEIGKVLSVKIWAFLHNWMNDEVMYLNFTKTQFLRSLVLA